MNLILSLILIAVAGVAYFEYTSQQQTSEGSQAQLSASQTSVAEIESQNKQLEQQKSATAKNIADAQNSIATLTAQLHAARKPVEAEAKPAPTSTAASAQPPPYSNDLGTISTLIGKTYQACHLLKVEADGITVSHAQGIVKILFPYLPPALQKEFGFNQNVSPDLTPERVEYQEQLRQSSPP